MNIPSNYFICIDILVVLLFIIFIFVGYKKGFLYELFSLIYTLASTIASWFLAPVFASLYPLIKLKNLTNDQMIIANFVNLEVILNTIAYFVIIFLVLKICYIVLSLLFKSINKVPIVGGFNRILGALMGIVNAAIITLFISMILSMPLIENGDEVKKNTVFAYINTYGEKAMSYIVENVDLNHIKSEFKDFDINCR